MTVLRHNEQMAHAPFFLFWLLVFDATQQTIVERGQSTFWIKFPIVETETVQVRRLPIIALFGS